MHACIGDFYEMSELLMKRGAEVKPEKGCPPIVQCVSKGSVRLLQLLLDHGADVNQANPKTSETPLLAACSNNRLDMVEFLLDHGADVNAAGDHHVTPLLLACISTNASLVECLMRHGANPLLTMDGGVTALHVLCEAGHMASIQILMKYPSFAQLVNTKSDDGLLPIVEAVQANHRDVVELLLPQTTELATLSVDEAMERFKPKAEKKEEAKPAHTVSAMDDEVIHHKKQEGVKLFNAGKYEEAIAMFNSALELNPEDEVLYSNRSSCYLRLKDYQHAMEDAETCIRLKPKWERGYYRKGMVFFEQKEYIDAATSFYQGCELAPADAKLSGKVGGVCATSCVVPGVRELGKALLRRQEGRDEE